MSTSRIIRSPRGSELTCKNWVTEAAYRMIQNNLDPEVAEGYPGFDPNLAPNIFPAAAEVVHPIPPIAFVDSAFKQVMHQHMPLIHTVHVLGLWVSRFHLLNAGSLEA